MHACKLDININACIGTYSKIDVHFLSHYTIQTTFHKSIHRPQVAAHASAVKAMGQKHEEEERRRLEEERELKAAYKEASIVYLTYLILSYLIKS